MNARNKAYEKLREVNYEDYKKAIQYAKGLIFSLDNKLELKDAATIEAAIVLIFLEFNENDRVLPYRL